MYISDTRTQVGYKSLDLGQIAYVRKVSHSYVAVGKLSSASKWRSAMLPCGLALVNSLLAIVAPGQSYVREVAH